MVTYDTSWCVELFPSEGTAVQIKSPRQVEILVPQAFGAILRVVGVVPHSPPESGGVPSRSEGGAVCSKTNSTD